jgi:dihydrolipoamide dehydrogenase
MDKIQVIVLGAGPGGYAAAFQAANLGLEVTLIDPKQDPGGVCLFHGCIPSKALLHIAKVKKEAVLAEEWGLSFSDARIDLDKVRSWKESVVKQLTGGIGQLAKSRKVRYLRGTAKLTGTNSLEFTPEDGKKHEIEFKNLVIATGASSTALPDIEFDDDMIMNSQTALEIRDIPKKLLIVGAGYIGLEMSVIYKALGSDVTIVEFTPDILPGVDQDLKDVFKKERKDLMDNTMFNTQVTSVTRKGKKLNVKLKTKEGEKKKETLTKY